MATRNFAGAASAAAVVFAALAAGFAPPPDMPVSTWAQDRRVVAAESGSPKSGPWRNALTPYLVEPMDCLSPTDPCTDVTLVFSAQSGKTEVGVNFAGYTIDADPAGMLIVLPAIDESHKFNKIKLQPTIEASPALRHKVREVKSRDENGSTASFKRFKGGFVQLTHAGSSKGLQAITVKKAWGDEISEWDKDVGGRGDPIDQIRQRTSTFALLGAKHLWTSTPKIKGACRISAFYEASDQRRFFFECPHCGDYFALRLEHLKHRSEIKPVGAYVLTPCCGAEVEHWQKAQMLERGHWLKTYAATVEGDEAPGVVVPRDRFAHFRARASHARQPGFHFWRGQSPWSNWDSVIEEYLAAKDIPLQLKTFTQQVLAEAFEEAGEAPDHMALLARRDERAKGAIPPGALVLTGMVDVQGNRLEWAVYGWGIALTSWLVDFGIVEGSPDHEDTWRRLSAVMSEQYEDGIGRAWPVEAWGIDAGYKSSQVYMFSRGRPNVLATDGRAGSDKPVIGLPKRMDFRFNGRPIKGGVMLWPLGTYALKSALYSALQKTIDGPDKQTGEWPVGCIRFPWECDEAFFGQITAEYMSATQSRDGRVHYGWFRKTGQANEQLDLWCGARAMAEHLGLARYSRAKWEALIAVRGTPEETGQRDLADLWNDPAHVAPEQRDAQERRLAAARRLADLNKKLS